MEPSPEKPINLTPAQEKAKGRAKLFRNLMVGCGLSSIVSFGAMVGISTKDFIDQNLQAECEQQYGKPVDCVRSEHQLPIKIAGGVGGATTLAFLSSSIAFIPFARRAQPKRIIEYSSERKLIDKKHNWVLYPALAAAAGVVFWGGTEAAVQTYHYHNRQMEIIARDGVTNKMTTSDWTPINQGMTKMLAGGSAALFVVGCESLYIGFLDKKYPPIIIEATEPEPA